MSQLSPAAHVPEEQAWQRLHHHSHRSVECNVPLSAEMEKFEKERQRQMRKSMLSTGVQELVNKMDSFINNRIQRDEQIIQKNAAHLAALAKEQSQKAQPADGHKNLGARPALLNNKTKRKQKSQQEIKVNSKNSAEWQQNLAIMREVIKEEEQRATQKAQIAAGSVLPDITGGQRKDCAAKSRAKTYLRQAHGLDDEEDDPEMILPRALTTEPCDHPYDKEAEHERLLQVMTWYADYRNNLTKSRDRMKVSQEDILKNFRKTMISTDLPSKGPNSAAGLQSMQAFIRKTEAFEGHEKFMDQLINEHGSRYLVLKNWKEATDDEVARILKKHEGRWEGTARARKLKAMQR